MGAPGPMGLPGPQGPSGHSIPGVPVSYPFGSLLPALTPSPSIVCAVSQFSVVRSKSLRTPEPKDYSDHLFSPAWNLHRNCGSVLCIPPSRLSSRWILDTL